MTIDCKRTGQTSSQTRFLQLDNDGLNPEPSNCSGETGLPGSSRAQGRPFRARAGQHEHPNPEGSPPPPVDGEQSRSTSGRKAQRGQRGARSNTRIRKHRSPRHVVSGSRTSWQSHRQGSSNDQMASSHSNAPRGQWFHRAQSPSSWVNVQRPSSASCKTYPNHPGTAGKPFPRWPTGPPPFRVRQVL